MQGADLSSSATRRQLFQRLDEERLEFLKTVLIAYTDSISEAATNTVQSCERMRASLQECNVETDIEMFINGTTTGSDIPGRSTVPHPVRARALARPGRLIQAPAACLHDTQSRRTMKPSAR